MIDLTNMSGKKKKNLDKIKSYIIVLNVYNLFLWLKLVGFITKVFLQCRKGLF